MIHFFLKKIFPIFFDKTKLFGSRMYKFLCITYIFFKKFFNSGKAPVFKFSHFYIKLYDDFYVIKLRDVRAALGNIPIYSIYWVFFLFLHHLHFYRKPIYIFTQILKFWNFLIFTIISGKIIFGAKSVKVVSLFWPKYIDTPVDLFDIMIRDSIREKKGVYEIYILRKKKRNIKIKKTFNFFFRKFKILLNTIHFLKKKKNIKRKNLKKNLKKLKNNVFFPIMNLIKNFINFSSKLYLVFFIRKQKFFNKGRYSRNRQLYRTGVYWCIYINVVVVLGLNFLFYKFSINFLQYWWFFYLILLSFFFSYFFKNSLYSYFYHFFLFKNYIFTIKQLKLIITGNFFFQKEFFNFFQKKIFNFFK